MAEHVGTVLAEARGLGIQRGGRWLVRGLDLTIAPGEIVTLIGPNGAGKSTTARAILGIIPPDAGMVARRPGLRVGYVPQKLSADWSLPLTVRRLMTLTAPHPEKAVEAALDELGIRHLAQAQVRDLSGGELQRALLARASIGGPDLLVLDEPVQGVDFNGEIALYDLIRRLRDRRRCGILLISHDLHIVMAQTDRVLCLNGHVCCSGTPEAVLDNPEYQKLFGPRAARAVALYTHRHDHEHGPDGSVLPLEHGHAHAHKDHGHA